MENPRRQVDILRARIARDDDRLRELLEINADEPIGEDQYRDVTEADREALLRMSDTMRLLPSEVGDFRQLKLLRHCTRMSESVDDVELVDVLEDEEAAREIVRWIHRTYTNEHTNQDYRTALRSFGRYHEQLDEPPETLSWIPTGTSNDFDPVPSERDLLDYEADILPMLDACQNKRDRALIAVQFEAGLRGGELYDLRVGDIFDGEHTVGLHVDGKEGERSVHLIFATAYLQQWRQEHPSGADQDYLWSKLSKPERPSYNGFLKPFKEAAKRAGVDRKVTPTNFRKSNTRYLVQLGMKQAKIEDRQGRTRGSEHTARYMARFGDDSLERAYACLHGKEVETDEPEEHGPITCPRCQRETPRNEDECVWCHFALSHEAAEEAKAIDQRHVESAAQAAGEEASKVVEADRIRRTSPAITRAIRKAQRE